MKENAVITICIGKDYEKIANISHPSIKNYADKINADFIVINTPSKNPHWEKFELYKYLKDYKRILYIDTDIIVRPDTPNLFEIVPYAEIGIFNEGRFDSREDALIQVFKEYNTPFPKDWNNTYYNTGVIVFSRIHSDLFKNPIPNYNLKYFEQSYVNLKLLTEPEKYKVFSLDYKFNRMCMMDVFGEPRESSYINHFAGETYIHSLPFVLFRMKQILQRWFDDYPDYDYKRNIVIDINGGLGDQICGEPAVRYFTEKIHPDDNIVVLTEQPEIFKHLQNCTVVDKYSFHPQNYFEDSCIFLTSTHPPVNNHPIWGILPNLQSHTTDFCSISLCFQMLPLEDKVIKLSYSDEALNHIKEICESYNIDINQLILIHPGKGWDSKTFPEKWWQSVLNKLIEDGHTIGVIGKFISDNENDITNRHGYCNITCNHERCIDFRDILSVEELVALIHNSKILISNDSAPIHIAGSSDINIILIPTCKHPDLVLPYRTVKGDQYYKTTVLYNKLTRDVQKSSPILIKLYGLKLDEIEGNIIDYLPDVEEIIKSVNNILLKDERSNGING